MLALAAMYGCQSSSSPRGGGMTKDVGFKIAVPTFSTEIKQGQTQNVTVSLERGDYFKQDVKLQIEASTGISVDPTSVIIKASDNPDVQLRIEAAKKAALGKYFVYVKGTPETGEPTSTVFDVRVVTP
jgi:uncharacterized membrane protein